MSEHPLILSFFEFIRKNRLTEHGDKILVSVSGGIDSMVMLDLLLKLSGRLDLNLAVAHFNHQLRGEESDQDEQFVRSASERFKLDCFVGTDDTSRSADERKMSIQEAARDLRYGFLSRIKASNNFHKIATAHNADDNAETILLNLMRGAGLHGMTGIPVHREDMGIIRPLLFAPRESIRRYSLEKQIRFREDSSNLKTGYTRNFLRHQIIPRVREKINPNLTTALNRTSEIFTSLEEYIGGATLKSISKLVERNNEKEIIIRLNDFNQEPYFMRENLLLTLCRQFTKSDVEFDLVEQMMTISKSESGSSCCVSRDSFLIRDRDRLLFRRSEAKAGFSHEVEIGNSYDFGHFGFSIKPAAEPEISGEPNTEFIDGDRLSGILLVRNWQEGDRFVPLGMQETKKISDFFIDEKIPLFEKSTIPILLSDGQIVWICGKRLDERFKLTPRTRNVIQLKYYPGKERTL